jgi:hypothetical protein
MVERSTSSSANSVVIFYRRLKGFLHFGEVSLPLALSEDVCATRLHPRLLAEQAYHRQ